MSSTTITPSAQLSGHWLFGGAVAISLVLHGAVLLALTGGWDRQLAETEETPVLVELVPPPEQPEPMPEPQGQPNSQERPAAPPSALPVLQPVIEFAETDAGPRVGDDGQSGRQPTERQPDQAERVEAEGTEAPDGNVPQILHEQAAATSQVQQQQVPLTEPEPGRDADAETGQIVSLITPTPRPERKPQPETGETGAATGAPPRPNEAVLDDPRILTAMAGMPRSQRINLLCMTVMRNQLETARPPRPPQYLPAFDLPAGNVLHPPEAAFLSRGQWFELAFRCEVDDGATKVLKFNYRIGEAIPRSQWSRRGFPDF